MTETNGHWVRLVKAISFDAAHCLPEVPEGHKCANLHGHSYRIELVCEGHVDPRTGWLVDFAEIKHVFEPLRKQLDHAYLNEIEGLANPTAENLARWIWDRVKPDLALLAQVTVMESADARCEYRGE
jgi:6-pyruvoyltetrahydropterin/6-carboxytetrahydropterin synthase